MWLGGRYHGQDRFKHAVCAQTIAQRPVTSRDLLMAYRWPAAVVLSSLVLAVTAAKLLSRPIPIAIKGGLQVDKLVLPPSVTIRSNTPLPVVCRSRSPSVALRPWRLKELFSSQLKTRLRFGQTCLSTTKSQSAARSTSRAR